MTDTITTDQQATAEHDRGSQTAPNGPSRSRLPLVIALGGVAVVVVAAAIAFWPSSSAPRPVAAQGFANGTPVDLVVTCGASGPCGGGVTAPDGTQWYWSTEVGTAIPAAWLGHDVAGQLHTDGEWGQITYTSNGQSITLVGGVETPEHNTFG